MPPSDSLACAMHGYDGIFSLAKKTCVLEKSKASSAKPPIAATTLPPGPNVTLRIFVDRSVCEVFCGGAAITTRLFPKEPLNATAVDVFAEGTPAQLLALDIYAMGSMWAPL